MKLEQRPLEGVLVIHSDIGHSVTLRQGHAHASMILKDGEATIPVKVFKPAGINVELLNEEGGVLESTATIKLTAFDTDPIVTKRTGQTYIDIQNNVSMKRLEAIQVGFKSKDGEVVASRTVKNMAANSDLFHFPELNGFEGKGTIVVQALTRHGEKYIKTLQVQL